MLLFINPKAQVVPCKVKLDSVSAVHLDCSPYSDFAKEIEDVSIQLCNEHKKKFSIIQIAFLSFLLVENYHLRGSYQDTSSLAGRARIEKFIISLSQWKLSPPFFLPFAFFSLFSTIYSHNSMYVCQLPGLARGPASAIIVVTQSNAGIASTCTRRTTSNQFLVVSWPPAEVPWPCMNSSKFKEDENMFYHLGYLTVT